MLTDIIAGDDASFTKICRDNGWKRTVQRRAIFNCLCGNRQHPSVESVWNGIKAHLPDVSLDSVYRILDEFAAAGVVRRIEGSKIIRYDAETRPHGHFICGECGRMVDFDLDDDEAAARICDRFGSVKTVEVNVRGTCMDCQSLAQQ